MTPLPSEEVTTERFQRLWYRKWLKPEPSSGLDWLICSSSIDMGEGMPPGTIQEAKRSRVSTEGP